MQHKGLRAKAARKFKVTTSTEHKLPVAPNLLKQDFTAARPNQKWVGDITYRVPGIRHLHGLHKRITNLSEIYEFETGVESL